MNATRPFRLIRCLSISALPFALACGGGGTNKTDGATTLPECTGTWPAAWAAKEQQLVTAVNALRAQGGTCSGVQYPSVPASALDPQLTQISRCFARDQMLAGSNALVGADANAALRDRVLASTFPGQLTGYDGDIVAASADDIVAEFLATPDYCAALFDATTTVDGVGYVEDPNGVVPQRWAGVTAAK